MIKEVIVVEGKDDLAAVKRACQAEVIITNGLGITAEKIAEIKAAQERCGVIILTDPDYPGEKIRRIIDSAVPGCRHAYLPPNCPGNQPGLIGVEYSNPVDIQKALEEAHSTSSSSQKNYTYEDLFTLGLVGHTKADQRRKRICEILKLGHTNGKQFLARLNAYNISQEEFRQALEIVKDEEK
ncbi:MAG: ribonuclease M5 [Peptococcia bacterium]